MGKRIEPGKGEDYKETAKELGTPTAHAHLERKENMGKLTSTQKTAMLKAWAAGMTFAEVAERFEYASPAMARAAIERAVAESDIAVDRAAERARFTVSLLGHHRKAAERASDDDDPDQMAWMRMDLLIVDRLAKLLGLDAPTQIVVTPGADEFEKLTAAVAIANGAKTVVEADPMEEG